MQPVSHPSNPFKSDGTLNLAARCACCGLVTDPMTGITLS